MQLSTVLYREDITHYGIYSANLKRIRGISDHAMMFDVGKEIDSTQTWRTYSRPLDCEGSIGENNFKRSIVVEVKFYERKTI